VLKIEKDQNIIPYFVVKYDPDEFLTGLMGYTHTYTLVGINIAYMNTHTLTARGSLL